MKTTIYSFRWIPILFVFILLASCDKDSGPYLVAVPVDTPEVNIDTTTTDTITGPTVYAYTISYNSHVKPMLSQNCVQMCHNPQHPKLDLRPPVSYSQLLTDGFSAPYVNVGTPNQSSLYLHLAGIYTLMPQGGPQLSQGKIDTVFTWISQGALNN